MKFSAHFGLFIVDSLKYITYNELKGGTYMTFGHRLTQLREDRGYHTRKSFAEKLGIPETTLRNYETDAREPGHTFLKQMSDFFNVSTDKLLGLTEEKERLSIYQLKESEYKHIKKYRFVVEHSPEGAAMVDTILDREYTIADMLWQQSKKLIDNHIQSQKGM